MKTFPTLYQRDSNGRVKTWSISAASLGPIAEMVTQYGLQGGKIQTNLVLVREGKNLGRANATDPYSQAKHEAAAKWQKQVDKGYVEDLCAVDAKSEIPRPMLAHPFAKRSSAIKWPAFVQPKMDGIRMIAVIGEDDVELYSRNAKPLTAPRHLVAPLLERFHGGEIVDGELFSPDMTLQDIVSGAKKKSDLTARLQFWIYDMAGEGTFMQRFARATEALGDDPAVSYPLVLVPTHYVDDEDEMRAHHGRHMELGFEGSIVRNANGKYKEGKRSPDLQKVKDFQDDEFEIVGFKDGVGNDEGLVTWECRTAKGREFSARPMGTNEQRAEWFQNGADYVGRMLTVKFMYYTPDGSPFHPVGMGIRDAVQG